MLEGSPKDRLGNARDERLAHGAGHVWSHVPRRTARATSGEDEAAGASPVGPALQALPDSVRLIRDHRTLPDLDVPVPCGSKGAHLALDCGAALVGVHAGGRAVADGEDAEVDHERRARGRRDERCGTQRRNCPEGVGCLRQRARARAIGHLDRARIDTAHVRQQRRGWHWRLPFAVHGVELLAVLKQSHLLGGRLLLVLGLPVGVRFAVHAPAGTVVAALDLEAHLLRPAEVPLGEAVAAEAREIHEVDVLHLGASLQVRH
mmetsp:Transcript_10573/g.35875  ORF Transcript_10573/g.35875 Transcript_10573/m.35875 type:complete len:262 (+) Transcript_10573:324-1109(+)